MISLAELIPDVNSAQQARNTVLTGLCEDSRRVQPGDGYVAIQGSSFDGHSFAQSAVANGARAVLAERQLDSLAVPVCVVPDLSSRRSELAAKVYARPSSHLCCVGVTGTNGKTSVCHYLAQMLNACDQRCGYMGTLGWGHVEALQDPGLTTVDACLFQSRLQQLHTAGNSHAALEISSHAIDQGRVDSVNFHTAVFTNLTRDHLDYHGSVENYAAAKQQLFARSELQCIVTNVDDKLGRKIGEQAQATNAAVVTYGSQGAVAWQDVVCTAQGFTGTWHTAWGDAPLDLPLLGRFSIENVAAVMAVLLHQGFALRSLAQACSTLRTVPGRMELFSGASLPNVIVDYAHTPDALERAALSAREHCQGQLHLVFGCGGDRDQGKRAQMGAVAAKVADYIWLTNDNPRSEAPAQIARDIEQGITAAATVTVQLDRGLAIAEAIAGAGSNDVVLVAGKGHETYQETAGVRRDFSDRDVVQAVLH